MIQILWSMRYTMTPDRLLTGLNCPHLCGIPASLKLRLCVCGAASRLAWRLPPSNQLTRSLVARLLLAIQPLLPSSLGQKRPGKTTQMAFSLIRKPFPSQIPAQEMAIIAMGNVTYFYLTQLSTMVWFLRVSSQKLECVLQQFQLIRRKAAEILPLDQENSSKRLE